MSFNKKLLAIISCVSDVASAQCVGFSVCKEEYKINDSLIADIGAVISLKLMISDQIGIQLRVSVICDAFGYIGVIVDDVSDDDVSRVRPLKMKTLSSRSFDFYLKKIITNKIRLENNKEVSDVVSKCNDLMKTKEPKKTIKFQARNTEVFVLFDIELNGKYCLNQIMTLLGNYYYGNLDGSGHLFLTPKRELLDTHMFGSSVDDLLANVLPPYISYDCKRNITSVNLIVWDYEMSELAYFPDKMFDDIKFNILKLGDCDFVSVIACCGFGTDWFNWFKKRA